MIYLDYAATSLIKPVSVRRAMDRALMTMASPGRGSHAPAMLAADTVYDCRLDAAKLFNVSEPERIVFTQNATHALNIAINSYAKKGMRVVISGYEHNSVYRPLVAAGCDVRVVNTPLFDADAFLNRFEKELKTARLAVCTHVSNAFGYILPVYELAGICRKYSVPLIVDASQSAGILEVDWQKLNAAFIAMPGHKGLLGPQGTGILICGDVTKPLLHGGSGSDSALETMPDYLPERLEAGTANVCGIAGLSEGIKFVSARGTHSIAQHERTLMQKAVSELAGVQGIELFTSDRGDQSGVLSMRFAKTDCESAAQLLGENGICVRPGLHCSPLAHRTAGTFDTGTVRMSFGPFTDESEVYSACAKIKEIIS